MATINGPLDFTGSLGNLRCYVDPATGKKILGKKGGYTKKQFDTLDSLEENRNNANDFGGSSMWASLLYASLSDLRHLMHSRCFNNVTSAGKLIQRQDVTSPHGYRSVEVGKDLQAIEQINFNEPRPLRSIIRNQYVIDFLPDKKTATLSIPGFVPATDAWWTTKFLAVRIYFVIAQTSDMVWNPVNKKYEPLIPDLEVLSCKTVSNWMYNNSIPVDVNLSVSLDEPAFSVPGTAVVVAMGVEFALSAINEQPYALPHNGSMKIVKCFKE
jgi:hypothetical protein